MFLGQYRHNFDTKGRLTIPARFRELLTDGAYVTRGFEKNLMVLTAPEFEGIVGKYHEEVDFVILDYLQLIRPSSHKQSTFEKVSDASNTVKLLAMRYDIPIIAVCQLNRGTEKEGRKPTLADLRMSGDIEQDADCVMLLHRMKERGAQTEALEIDIAKHRGGGLGVVEMNYHMAVGRIEEPYFQPEER